MPYKYFKQLQQIVFFFAVSYMFLMAETTASAAEKKVYTSKDFIEFSNALAEIKIKSIKHFRENCNELLELNIRIHPSVPPLLVRLIADPDSGIPRPTLGDIYANNAVAQRWNASPESERWGTGSDPGGRIEIYKIGASTPFQSLDIHGSGIDDRCSVMGSLNLPDINFDGYADLSFVNDGGAKWRSFTYFVYDVASGRFVENSLTKEFDDIGSQSFHVDVKKQEFRADILGSSGCSDGGTETFKLRDGHLVIVEDEHFILKGKQCFMETRQLINGALKVVKTKRYPVYDEP